MASSSNSSLQKSLAYDVFLSFRGEDTRKNFVDHLYVALEHQGIYTYKDDQKMEKGKQIKDDLIKSIQGSKFFIIVFSKNYASSSWCLDELVRIMERHKTTGQKAYPVFYDVEPSEIRKQSGAFGDAFAKLKDKVTARKRMKEVCTCVPFFEGDSAHEHKDEAVVQKWREALADAANLSGWDLKKTADGHEANVIQKIVDEISLELRTINYSVDKKLVGMESRVNDVESILKMDSNEVSMIGIKGMGGSGKTTLARAVYDQIGIQFEGKSFVENVREVSKNSLSGLKSLQRQVLTDVLDNQNITVNSVIDGKSMMKRRICGKKVLVVLDDVDHIDQLEALAGELSWFKPGSVVIITTRDEQVLIAHHVRWIRDVTLLSYEEADSLFSRYAFGNEIPNKGYKELSEQVVSYAAGLPLTIKVLGSFLCGKIELEWKDVLERLRNIPLKETQEKLELSYISLEDDYKEIFLDVACFLKDYEKDKAIRILDSRRFHAINGLRVLEQKSLITIKHTLSGEYIGMHDHLQEMGRNIVRRNHPDQPNKHSRLWIHEEIENVLANNLDNEATWCIVDHERLSPEALMKGFGSMKKLRILVVYYRSEGCSNWRFDEVNQYFPNALQYLECDGYPFHSLPETFQADNLVALEMNRSNIVQLWDGRPRKVLNNLKYLKITYSKLKNLDLRLTPNLRLLHLHGYGELELHMSIRFPELTSLCLEHIKLKTFDLSLTPKLQKLTLSECCDFIELLMPINGCPQLTHLKVTGTKLNTLDLKLTPNLLLLHLHKCDELVELHMPFASLQLESLELGHLKLKTLNVGLTPKLQRLTLRECHDLVELNTPDGCLEELTYLDLSGCSSFKYFYLKKQLESLDFDLTAELYNIHPSDSSSGIPICQLSCVFRKQLFLPNGNLQKLISLALRRVTDICYLSETIFGSHLKELKIMGKIAEIPQDLGRLKCLEKLHLMSPVIEDLPDSICLLKNLKYLQLKDCWLLEKLPMGLGQLEFLQELILLECCRLRDVPNTIYMMKRLKRFQLRGCISVINLPDGIGHIESLEVLDIAGTGIFDLPQSIFVLKGLQLVASSGLIKLTGYTFTNVRHISEDVTSCYI